MGLNWQRGRCLSEFSTFGVGGPILLFAIIGTIEEMEDAFSFARAKSLPLFILGKGSNCLFDDAGFEGIVLLNRIDFISIDEEWVEAGAGANFSLLGIQTSRKGLSGLEFASGIPASLGGAIYMNAGANGRETCERLITVQYLDIAGKRQEFRREALTFGYRTSSFQTMRGAILSASFCLEREADARQRQIELLGKRIRTQPLKEKSAGCVFRNPSRSISAGALIDQCGLKGFRVGGAAVSEVHANFLINCGGATSKDLRCLIEKVQNLVYEKTEVYLEPEIKIIGPHG